jgi:hypothetical protein
MMVGKNLMLLKVLAFCSFQSFYVTNLSSITRAYAARLHSDLPLWAVGSPHREHLDRPSAICFFPGCYSVSFCTACFSQ